ncbi:hypothetical protein Bca52824_032721 [Brassica carinata]|uniref:Uncharacterized protein n=1 Tax=Brassica carinata TaxID=52824 RepID=A0A8X7SCJ5_BRACI|nr:hypothetical protein Bca52824_032721 [Brassica carinata]
MGSVCSSGFKDDDHDKKKLRSTLVVDVDDDKSRGFSGKLKSMRRKRPLIRIILTITVGKAPSLMRITSTFPVNSGPCLR